MTEPDNLVQQLRGRAAFCRDRGEVKTPELLEAAADRLADAEAAQAALVERAVNEIDCGCQDGVCRFAHACPKSDVDAIRALASDAGVNALAELRAERDDLRDELNVTDRLLTAEAEASLKLRADRDRLAAKLAEAEAQVAALRDLVEVAGRARLIIDTGFLEMGETVNYAPSVISEVCDMLEPHSALTPAEQQSFDASMAMRDVAGQIAKEQTDG